MLPPNYRVTEKEKAFYADMTSAFMEMGADSSQKLSMQVARGHDNIQFTFTLPDDATGRPDVDILRAHMKKVVEKMPLRLAGQEIMAR